MDPSPTPPARTLANWLLGAVALGSFLLLFHIYGLNLLPPERITIPPAKIYPLPGPRTFAYVYDFDRSESDRPFKPRSQAALTENGVVLRNRKHTSEEVLLVGGDRWVHEPGRILFASSDNSDPRRTAAPTCSFLRGSTRASSAMRRRSLSPRRCSDSALSMAAAPCPAGQPP